MRLVRASRPSLSAGEWGLLGAVLLATISIAVPGWTAWVRSRYIARARRDIRALERSLVRYQREYSKWPAKPTERGTDVRFGDQRPNAELVRILTARTEPTEAEISQNPHKIVFLHVELPQKSHSTAGGGYEELLDPWGEPYQVVLDSDYSGSVVIRSAPSLELPDRDLAIWSKGPDRLSGTKDDIVSWK